MSKSIDERVLEMKFDNKHFESNVQTSLSTLDKLKQSLNLSGASKGLENVASAAKNNNMSTLGEAVESVRMKFSALQVMAVAALTNITNKVVDAGLQLAKSFVLDPITEGFAEYELKMGSIQTIMAGTGESLETVNSYLDELNVYADKTIYSFADMTSNIGKFTNAGVSLKDSVAAIQGVSNVAALSGANTNEASRAMYNFAQALSAGHVKLIDWKSIENANMATVEFKQELINSAVAVGTLKERTDGMYKTLDGTVISATKNFNDSLQDQWMTTEVLVSTLGRYSDETTDIGKRAFAAAQDIKTLSQLFDTLKESVGSGWAQSWEIVVGDFEEAKALFTGLGEAVGGFIERSSDARNEMLQFWKDNGGRDALIQSFKNAFEGLASVITPIKEAFRDIFPPATGETLLSITDSLVKFTEKLKIGDETSDKLKRTFSGLFAAIDLVTDAFGFVFKIAGEVFGLFGGSATSGILSLTARFGDLVVSLRDTAKEGNIFGVAFEKVKEIFTTVSEKIKDVITRIKDAFNGFKGIDMSPLEDFAENAENRFRPFEKVGQIISKAFEAIVTVLEWAAPIVRKLGEIISEALGKLADIVSNAVQNMEFNELLDLTNSGLFAAILLGVKSFISSLTEVTSGAGGMLDGITGILDGVRGSLEAYQSSIKAKTLLTIASAIGILAAALVVLSLIPSEKLTVSLVAISALFLELSATMIVLGKALNNVQMAKISVQLVAMSAAILILSVAMKSLAELDWEGLAKGTVGIAALAATLVISANMLDSSSGKLIKGSTGLIAFSAAILVMAKAVDNLSALSWEELAKGLTGLTVILAEVVALTHLMGNSKMISTGVGMTALGAAMLIFASAIKQMGQLSWDEIARGLTTMAGALTSVTLAMNLMPSGMVSKATGMVIMGAALQIIAEAVAKFGNLQWDEIARGITAMAGALAAITLSLNLMPKDVLGKAAGLIGVAAALQIMIDPLKQMAGMSWEEIAKGLVMLGGSMAILAVALNAMQNAIPGAAAMLIVAPALAIMASVLQSLGSMPLSEIGAGLLALAGVFTVLGVAALLLQPLVPTMIGLAAGIALLGVGVAAVGIGVLALATGLTALSVGATAAAASIVVIGSAVLSLIPIFFEKVGEGLIALCNVVIDGAPALGEAFVVLIQTAMESLKVAVPAIVDAIFVLVMGILTALDENLPDVVDKLFSIVTGFLEKVAEHLPELIQAGADLLGAFLKGIFDAMGGFQPENLFNILSCITLLVASFAILAASKKLAADAIVAVGMMAVVMGIITALFVIIASFNIDNVLEISISLSTVLLAISAAMVILSAIPVSAALTAVADLGIFVGGLAVILAAFGALAQIPGLEWLMGEGSRLLGQIGTAIGAFAGNIIGGFLTSVSSSFPQIGADLAGFIENVKPFIDGVKNIDASALDGVKVLAETVLVLTAASILDGIASFIGGGSSMVDFGKQISDFAPYFVSYYNQIKGVDGSVVEASANAAKALAEFSQNIPNSGGLLAKITGENSITQFAQELQEFGPALMAYSQSVSGLNADVIVNSANAAKSLSEFAQNIPSSGGLLAKITGDNSITQFAKELQVFGPALMGYAQSVTGLDGSVVTNSANAASALAEFANKIPDSGGLLSKITGDNSITQFGAELASFGPHLAAYGQSISGLDGSVVVNSANAASALAEFATKLPNSGGLAALFSGDNNIAKFGENLAKFGEQFGKYYGYIQAIDVAQLSSAIIEIEKLITLASGIVDLDSSGMKKFGDNIAKFGEQLGKYYSKIQAIDMAQLSLAVAEVNNLVGMAKGMVDLDTSGMTNFSTALTALGKAGIDGFISAFTNASPQITAAATSLITSFTTGITAKEAEVLAAFTTLIESGMTALKKDQDFILISQALMDNFIAGVKVKDPAATSAFIQIVSGALTAIRDKYPEFESVGQGTMTNFIAGVKLGDASAISAFTQMISGCITAINTSYAEFNNAGKHMVEGFANGITENTYLAEAKAKAMAAAAAAAAKKELEVKSPSRVGYSIGNFFGMGFVNAIGDYVKKAFQVGSQMAESAKQGLSNTVSKISDVIIDGLDAQPTIRPVLDLSDIQAGTSTLNALFSRTRAMSISSDTNNNPSNEIQNDDRSSQSGNSYQFTQNNYSPKALSRLEIYRQTKNQFSALKGTVLT